MAVPTCTRCDELCSERIRLLAQIAALADLVALQQADLDRYKKAVESATPNQPERVPANQLQLAFEEVLASISDKAEREALEEAATDGDEDGEQADGAPSNDNGTTKDKNTRGGRGGRRALDLTKLPVEDVTIDPDEVVAAGGVGFECIGAETSDRVAVRPATMFRLRITRRKWARVDADDELDDLNRCVAPVAIATIPESVWPYFMADPSAIAHGIVSKYGDLLPLHRQESISRRHGFTVPRSTLCDWLKAAHRFCDRIVDAMMNDAKARAFCIATDATGAPVRGPGRGACSNWQVFAFLADHEHVIFRYAPSGTGEAVAAMLEGFRGNLLADAASIFDILFDQYGMTESGCWAHCRRYFFKALAAQRDLAMQALAVISKLFMVARACERIEMPQRTKIRAERAHPILSCFDGWIAENKSKAEPRGPLRAAIGYYENQRGALRHFLEDGRLPIHNNRSESALRNLVLGRHNWKFFENETGLKYYTVFRSLIASCALHDLNPQSYLEDVLRLAPHWPANRVIELAPKAWAATRDTLDERHREILVPPWARTWPTVSATAPPSGRAV